MRLVSFSVQNYRSITKANKIEVGRSTVLVGPNNEGKSNVLRALVTSMKTLTQGSVAPFPRSLAMVPRFFLHRSGYDWQKDFPIHLQHSSPDGKSVFVLEFELDDDEVEEFRQEIKSNLNGTLPIQFAFGRTRVEVTVHKKGPGAKKLSQKSSQIAYFVARRIEFEYIPAIRTAKSAQRVVNSLIEKELASVESAPEYKEALTKIQELQQPVLDALSKSIRTTLVGFLPAIKNVEFEITSEQRFAALRRSARMIVDDGTPTELEYKGDGVQSLAAIALMRHASESGSKGKNFVIAVEEPESHLHPSAMHALRGVLRELAEKYQVVITTHSPLFVDRTNISSNVLVNKNKAMPAKSIEQIRSILGVRVSDNLRHAELVLVVEGDDDRIALNALLRAHDSMLQESINNGRLAIETLSGGTNLSYVLGLVKDALLCACHCFLDDDDCGRKSFQKANAEGLVEVKDVNFASVLGMKESELEDLYDLPFYKGLIWNTYKVPLDSPRFGGKKKWSDRMADVFKAAGKPWNDAVKADVKARVANLVASDSANALNQHKRAPFESLAASLIARLQELPDSD
jgi:putative ATP-dependent endonuclease of OLD family